MWFDLAEHLEDVSHDVVNDFLRQKRFMPREVWKLVKDRIEESKDACLIVDDSVHDKRYSRFIELVRAQYRGNEHGRVPRVACYPCGAVALADKPPVAPTLSGTDFDRQNSLGAILVSREAAENGANTRFAPTHHASFQPKTLRESACPRILYQEEVR
jgi:hypothetical protein